MEDSGIGAMLLESPCLSELETPHTSNTCFLSLLNCLDLFPLSPENERLVYHFYNLFLLCIHYFCPSIYTLIL